MIAMVVRFSRERGVVVLWSGGVVVEWWSGVVCRVLFCGAVVQWTFLNGKRE